MERRELLGNLEAGRERLLRALASLPVAAMDERVDEAWTRKDVVAHLEAWERRVIDLFEALRRGEMPSDGPETDELNARFHVESRDRPLADVLAGEAAAWASLIALVERATDAELFDPDHFAWTEGDPFVGWINGNAHDHIDEHLEQLTRPAAAPGS